MEDLISDKDITNQMVYYLVADEPVVTGVVKDVKVEDEVVTVTMYANFIGGETYYFAYGKSEPVSFKTAQNGDKYVKAIKLVEEKAYPINATTKITYKLLNEDGVEITATGTPTIDVVSDNAWKEGDGIYFFQEGTATIKATFHTGEYDPDTFESLDPSDSITVTGTVAGAAEVTSKEYSFSPDKTTAQIRVKENATLYVEYKDSDDKTTKFGPNPAPAPVPANYIIIDGVEYKLQSTDETIAMITGADQITGIKKGKATIVLYRKVDGNWGVYDAFAITVEDENRGASAAITLTENTYNDAATGHPDVQIKVKATDLDGDKWEVANTTTTIEQVENNKTAVDVELSSSAGASSTFEDIYDLSFNIGPKAPKYASVRFVVTVKDTDSDIVIGAQTFTVVVANLPEDPAEDSYKVSVDNNALDTSIKRYEDNPIDTAKMTVNVVRATSYGDFFIKQCDDWTFKDKASSIAPTVSALGVDQYETYVIVNYPKNYEKSVITTTTGTSVTIANFPSSASVDKRATTGTYTFTGYRVTYAKNTGKKSAQVSLGSAQVIVSKNDVAPTVTIADGRAAAFESYKNDNTDLGYKKAFSVNWDGKADPADITIRKGTLLNDGDEYKYDVTSESYYVYYLPYEVTIDAAGAGNLKFTSKSLGKLTVGKLFKDDKAL